jgi:molybdopterin biosynthesis enzyme
VRWTPQGVIDYDNQSSGVLFSTTWGDGFVRQRAGQSISRGNPVDYLPFAAFD